MSSGVMDVTLLTNICSQLAECLYATFVTKLGIVVHYHKPGMSCGEKRDYVFKVKVTVMSCGKMGLYLQGHGVGLYL